MTWFTVTSVLQANSSPVDNFSTPESIKSIIFLKTPLPRPIWIRITDNMMFFTGTLSYIAMDITPLACGNSPLERQRLFSYISFRLSSFRVFTIGCTCYLHFYRYNIQSKQQYGDIPSFPRTKAYKYRSPLTKTRGLAAFHIFLPLVL